MTVVMVAVAVFGHVLLKGRIYTKMDTRYEDKYARALSEMMSRSLRWRPFN